MKKHPSLISECWRCPSRLAETACGGRDLWEQWITKPRHCAFLHREIERKLSVRPAEGIWKRWNPRTFENSFSLGSARKCICMTSMAKGCCLRARVRSCNPSKVTLLQMATVGRIHLPSIVYHQMQWLLFTHHKAFLTCPKGLCNSNKSFCCSSSD